MHLTRPTAKALLLQILLPTLTTLVLTFGIKINFLKAAEWQDSIIAIVEDQPITSSEINKQINLLVFLSDLPNNEEIRAGLMPQALNLTTENVLMRKITNDSGFSTTEEDIDIYLDYYLASKQQTLPQLKSNLQDAGVDYDSFINNISTILAWNQYISFKHRDKIILTKDEISNYREELILSTTTTRFYYKEILLRDNKQSEQDSGSLARLVVESLNGGADFSSIASQLSILPSAKAGGLVGPVIKDEIPITILTVLESLSIGQTSKPFNYGKDIMLVQLQAVSFPKVITEREEISYLVIKSNSSKELQAGINQNETLQSELDSILKLAVNCQAARIAAKIKGWEFEEINSKPIDNLNDSLQIAFKDQQPPFKFVVRDESTKIYVLCNTGIGYSGIPSNQEIQRGISDIRIAQIGKRELENAKKKSFIKIF